MSASRSNDRRLRARRNTVLALVGLALLGALALYTSLSRLDEVATLGAADPEAGMAALSGMVLLTGAIGSLIVLGGGLYSIWRGRWIRRLADDPRYQSMRSGLRLRGTAWIATGWFLAAVGIGGLVIGGVFVDR